MKRILCLIFLLGASAVYSRAYSAPICSKILQSKQDKLVKAALDSLSGTVHREDTAKESKKVHYYIRPTEWGTDIVAVEVIVWKNSRVDIIVRGKGNQINDAYNWLLKAYEDTAKEFGSLSISQLVELRKAGILTEKGKRVIHISMVGSALIQNKADVLNYFISQTLR